MRIALLVGLVACSGGGTDALDKTDSPVVDDTGTVMGEISATARRSDLVAAVWHVDVTSSVSGTAFVEFGLDGALDRSTPDSAQGVAHDLPLLGLKAGRSYSWRAVVVDGGGQRHESEVGTFEVERPGWLVPVDVTVSEPDAEHGYLLTSVFGASAWVGILDRDGDWVWWMEQPPAQIVTQLAPGLDGESLLWLEYQGKQENDTALMRRVPLDGDGEEVLTRSLLGHHAFVEHENTLAWLAFDLRDLDLGGPQPISFITDRILLGPEGGTTLGEPDTLFSFFDDFPYGPVLTCPHMFFSKDRLGLTDSQEWTHTNSMVYVPELGAYIIHSKFADWVLAIDVQTGELLWQLHGAYSDFVGPLGEDLWLSALEPGLWSHGHMSDAWDGGLLMFDNGDHRDVQVSRVVEVAFDTESDVAQEVWSFSHPEDGFSSTLGDARQLPSGNVLTTWGKLAEVMEVTQDHRIVWRGQLRSSDYTIARIKHLPDLYALPAPW